MAKKSRKAIIISIALLVVLSAIVALSIYQSQLQAKTYTVEEYFDVSAAVEPMANDRIESNGTIWILHAIEVHVKAVIGDAYGVVVQSWAGSEDLILGDIPRGQMLIGTMISSTGGRITQKEDGNFYVTLTIRSAQATGRVSIYLPP